MKKVKVELGKYSCGAGDFQITVVITTAQLAAMIRKAITLAGHRTEIAGGGVVVLARPATSSSAPAARPEAPAPGEQLPLEGRRPR